MSEEIKLTIRMSSGDQFEVTVPTAATVADLKKACEEGSKMSAESQRLIFKGKLLSEKSIGSVLVNLSNT